MPRPRAFRDSQGVSHPADRSRASRWGRDGRVLLGLFFWLWLSLPAYADDTPMNITFIEDTSSHVDLEVFCEGDRITLMDRVTGERFESPEQMRSDDMKPGDWMDCHHGQPHTFFDERHGDE